MVPAPLAQPASPKKPERGTRCRDAIKASLPVRLRLDIITELATGHPRTRVLGFVAENTKVVHFGLR